MNDRQQVADELRRVREAVRARALHQRAATLPVVRLITHEADLEEVFLSFYAGDGGAP